LRPPVTAKRSPPRRAGFDFILAIGEILRSRQLKMGGLS
jgi:hypothetical protein